MSVCPRRVPVAPQVLLGAAACLAVVAAPPAASAAPSLPFVFEIHDDDVSVAGTGPVGTSLSRSPDPATGVGVWSGAGAATPGTADARSGPAPEPAPSGACDLTVTHEIGQVQGTGPATPLADAQVVVRGVVVGDTPGLSGYYLQDADGDGDVATSDGIFVVSTLAVDPGDTIAVTGRVEERAQTQISARDGAQVCTDGSTADLPEPAALDLPSADAARERLEGMLVRPEDALTVSEVFDLTSFGELTLSEGGPLVQPTELARPGVAADAVAADNALRRIVLDDARSARVGTATRPYLTATTPVRVGDTLTFTEPVVLGHGFGAWRLQPADGTADGVFAPGNSRTGAPDAVGGDVQVAAFNVLNYFLTSTGHNARGARSAAQLELQTGKIVPAIEALGAEVVTLMEIEDTGSTGYSPGDADRALAELVRRLNAAAGYAKWTFVPLPDELYAVQRDAIRNGILYQPGVVQPAGDPVGLVDESTWSNAREPVAQRFVKDGDAFTVIANHLKSKSAGAATGDNVDTGDGQGQWNGDRTRQAASLARFAAALRRQTGEPDVLLLGDFNAYTQEDPVETLRRAGFVDLGQLLDPTGHSYVFDGMSGSLDHALATRELAGKVTDLTHWDINAVESSAYQYTGDRALHAPDPYRSSDHDPLVLGIDLQERCHGLPATLRGTSGDDVLTGSPGVDVVVGLDGDDVITGSSGDDVICGGAGDDRLDGGNGADQLRGGFGEDRLDGGNGDDHLVGGPGTDRLEQGRGTGTDDQDGDAS